MQFLSTGLAAGRRGRPFFHFLLLWAFIFPSLTSSSSAQVPTVANNATISVSYVMVPFVALDRRGAPIRDLREKQVELVIDGVPAKFDMFERTSDAPVSYTILLDVSGSMALAGKMEGARTALNSLLSGRLPRDDFSLHFFSAGEVREAVPFTRDISKIVTSLFRIEPYGKTAFFDALSKMPDKTILGENGSRAIILITDGLDNASTISRDDLRTLLARVDVPVYALGLRSDAPSRNDASLPADAWTDTRLLSEIAESTGGRAFITSNLGALERAIAEIQKDLRSQYLVGFAPTGKGATRFRTISLKLAGSARSVRVRTGYRGSEPPRPALAQKAVRSGKNNGKGSL